MKNKDLKDYKKFHKLMVTQLKVPSVKRSKSQDSGIKLQDPKRKPHLKFKKDASSK